MTRRRSAAASAPADPTGKVSAWGRFQAWRRRRPFVGGILIALGGLEMFGSSQLDVGNLHIQMGIEGLQATVIPIVLVLLGILVIAMPAHRIFYGVIALAVAVYSLVGVNLGGFFIGMLLSTVGGIIAVSWMPRKPAAETADDVDVVSEPVDSAVDGDETRAEAAAATPRIRRSGAWEQAPLSGPEALRRLMGADAEETRS